VLEPEARAVMTELVRVSGRPMVHDLRATLDAIGYLARYGIEWRALPVDFLCSGVRVLHPLVGAWPARTPGRTAPRAHTRRGWAW
jgi:hypothetical protein